MYQADNEAIKRLRQAQKELMESMDEAAAKGMEAAKHLPNGSKVIRQLFAEAKTGEISQKTMENAEKLAEEAKKKEKNAD